MANIKKVAGILLCGVLLFSLSACSIVFVNEDRDMAQVVAKINDTELTKKDFIEAADAISYQQNGMLYEQYKKSATDENLKLFKEAVLDNLVNGELLHQKAVADGMEDNSEENRNKVKEEIEKEIASTKEYYESNAETQEGKDPAVYVQEMMDKYLESTGYNDMEAAISAKIKSESVKAIADKLDAEVTYTEQDAKEMYDLQVDAQVKSIKENPSMFQMYQSMGGQVFARPDGARFVKHILISLPEDVQNEIKVMRSNKDDAGADALRDAELAKIKVSADEALARVNQGEEFDTLVEELGQDPGMKSEPAKTQGYLVYEGSGMVAEFEQAALALKNVGDVTGLVPTDFGYHIIKYVKDGSGQIPFDEVKEDMIKSGLASKQQSHRQEFIDGLKKDAKTKTYIDRV